MSGYDEDEYGVPLEPEPEFFTAETIAALPQTADEFQGLSNEVALVSNMIGSSPGAWEYWHQAAVESHQLVAQALDAEAAAIGGVIGNHTDAVADANNLTAAAVRSGDTPEEAQAWALRAAAKRGAGQDTYKDVAERFSKTTHGQRIEAGGLGGMSRRSE